MSDPVFIQMDVYPCIWSQQSNLFFLWSLNFIKQYDTVLLKDGSKASIVEAFENKVFIADVGDSPKDWETIDITIGDIEKMIHTTKDWYRPFFEEGGILLEETSGSIFP